MGCFSYTYADNKETNIMNVVEGGNAKLLLPNWVTYKGEKSVELYNYDGYGQFKDKDGDILDIEYVRGFMNLHPKYVSCELTPYEENEEKCEHFRDCGICNSSCENVPRNVLKLYNQLNEIGFQYRELHTPHVHEDIKKYYTLIKLVQVYSDLTYETCKDMSFTDGGQGFGQYVRSPATIHEKGYYKLFYSGEEEPETERVSGPVLRERSRRNKTTTKVYLNEISGSWFKFYAQKKLMDRSREYYKLKDGIYFRFTDEQGPSGTYEELKKIYLEDPQKDIAYIVSVTNQHNDTIINAAKLSSDSMEETQLVINAESPRYLEEISEALSAIDIPKEIHPKFNQNIGSEYCQRYNTLQEMPHRMSIWKQLLAIKPLPPVALLAQLDKGLSQCLYNRLNVSPHAVWFDIEHIYEYDPVIDIFIDMLPEPLFLINNYLDEAGLPILPYISAETEEDFFARVMLNGCFSQKAK